MYKRILIAVDASKVADRGLDEGIRLAASVGASVRLVHVLSNVAPGRYVVAGSYRPWREMIALMDELTGTRVRRVRIDGRMLRWLGRVGDLVKHVYPFDFPLSSEAMDFATQWPGVVPSPAIERLGIRFRDGRETYTDTIRWLYRAGHLTRREAGKLAD